MECTAFIQWEHSADLGIVTAGIYDLTLGISLIESFGILEISDGLHDCKVVIELFQLRVNSLGLLCNMHRIRFEYMLEDFSHSQQCSSFILTGSIVQVSKSLSTGSFR